jgi:hypothetical protein
VKASEIVIKIYNQQTIRIDLGEKMIHEYAMKVAEEAYRMGFNAAQKNKNARPAIALAGLNMDKINEENQ